MWGKRSCERPQHTREKSDEICEATRFWTCFIGRWFREKRAFCQDPWLHVHNRGVNSRTWRFCWPGHLRWPSVSKAGRLGLSHRRRCVSSSCVQYSNVQLYSSTCFPKKAFLVQQYRFSVPRVPRHTMVWQPRPCGVAALKPRGHTQSAQKSTVEGACKHPPRRHLPRPVVCSLPLLWRGGGTARHVRCIRQYHAEHHVPHFFHPIAGHCLAWYSPQACDIGGSATKRRAPLARGYAAAA